MSDDYDDDFEGSSVSSPGAHAAAIPFSPIDSPADVATPVQINSPPLHAQHVALVSPPSVLSPNRQPLSSDLQVYAAATSCNALGGGGDFLHGGSSQPMSSLNLGGTSVDEGGHAQHHGEEQQQQQPVPGMFSPVSAQSNLSARSWASKLTELVAKSREDHPLSDQGSDSSDTAAPLHRRGPSSPPPRVLSSPGEDQDGGTMGDDDTTLFVDDTNLSARDDPSASPLRPVMDDAYAEAESAKRRQARQAVFGDEDVEAVDAIIAEQAQGEPLTSLFSDSAGDEGSSSSLLESPTAQHGDRRGHGTDGGVRQLDGQQPSAAARAAFTQGDWEHSGGTESPTGSSGSTYSSQVSPLSPEMRPAAVRAAGLRISVTGSAGNSDDDRSNSTDSRPVSSCSNQHLNSSNGSGKGVLPPPSPRSSSGSRVASGVHSDMDIFEGLSFLPRCKCDHGVTCEHGVATLDFQVVRSAVPCYLVTSIMKSSRCDADEGSVGGPSSTGPTSPHRQRVDGSHSVAAAIHNYGLAISEQRARIERTFGPKVRRGGSRGAKRVHTTTGHITTPVDQAFDGPSTADGDHAMKDGEVVLHPTPTPSALLFSRERGATKTALDVVHNFKKNPYLTPLKRSAGKGSTGHGDHTASNGGGVYGTVTTTTAMNRKAKEQRRSNGNHHVLHGANPYKREKGSVMRSHSSAATLGKGVTKHHKHQLHALAPDVFSDDDDDDGGDHEEANGRDGEDGTRGASESEGRVSTPFPRASSDGNDMRSSHQTARERRKLNNPGVFGIFRPTSAPLEQSASDELSPTSLGIDRRPPFEISTAKSRPVRARVSQQSRGSSAQQLQTLVNPGAFDVGPGASYARSHSVGTNSKLGHLRRYPSPLLES